VEARKAKCVSYSSIQSVICASLSFFSGYMGGHGGGFVSGSEVKGRLPRSPPAHAKNLLKTYKLTLRTLEMHGVCGDR